MGRLGKYRAIRNTMLKDPEKAQEMINKFGDFKVPVFINASIHGNENPGVDAAIRLIETMAYEDTPEVQAILENTIRAGQRRAESGRPGHVHAQERQRLRHQPGLSLPKPSPKPMLQCR